MAQQNRNRFILVYALVISLFFLILMLVQGAPLAFALVASIVIGLLTAAVSTMSYAYKAFLQRRAFAGKKQSAQSLESNQQRTVEIDVPIDVAFDLAIEALKTLDKQRVPVPDDVLIKMEMLLPRTQHLNIRKTDRVSGLIQAGLKASTLKIPEFIDFSRIAIQLEKIDDTTTRLHIESKTNNIFDAYDMGKNLHYVNQIALYLRRESQSYSAESRLGDHDRHMMDADDDDESSRQQQSG